MTTRNIVRLQKLEMEAAVRDLYLCYNERKIETRGKKFLRINNASLTCGVYPIDKKFPLWNSPLFAEMKTRRIYMQFYANSYKR